MDIFEALYRQGACECGTVAAPSLAERMPRGQAERLCSIYSGVQTVIMAAFPYYAGNGGGNISLYARGVDYHSVVKGRLEAACKAAELDGVALVDASPIPEAYAAALAGCGAVGLNGLLITPDCGSLVFIGAILTGRDVVAEERSGTNTCDRCGRCAEACPTGALRVTEGNRAFNRELCLSYLTQKKGALTGRENRFIAQNGMVWGCDRCQLSCPRNYGISLTGIPEFLDKLVCNIPEEQLSGMPDEEFLRLFGDRAFAWRGLAPLKRNAESILCYNKSKNNE